MIVMKKIVIVLFSIFLMADFSQAKKKEKVLETVDVVQNSSSQKKPTLMILPSDNWCNMRFFMTTWNNQGVEVKTPNYLQAFQEDTELGQVISKVGGLLTDLGYSIKDAEQELRTLNQRQAEDNMTTSKNQGSFLAESPLDQLKKRVKSDILIQIWWKVNKEREGRSVSFTLEAFDAYTSKRIGTSTGTGNVSSEIVPVLLEEAVKSNVADFDRQMVAYYKNINQKGREIVLTLKKWDSWSEDFESDFDGVSLSDIVEEWMHSNTVGDSYNLTDATENFMQFEQVRIPLTNAAGRPIDARTFSSGLMKHLKSKYGIPSKLMTRGLGEAILVLGEQ